MNQNIITIFVRDYPIRPYMTLGLSQPSHHHSNFLTEIIINATNITKKYYARD